MALRRLISSLLPWIDKLNVWNNCCQFIDLNCIAFQTGQVKVEDTHLDGQVKSLCSIILW